MMEAIRSSETSVQITEGGILHSNRNEILKSYVAFTGWAL
jgi:hypothetical protein